MITILKEHRILKKDKDQTLKKKELIITQKL